ncbi:MFS transporter [Streptomyces sp. NPDC052236]|uniref:MFS transporter n=1 Tax=Streptomyces sp. NPDC052236 TaxID=3365686 RepID=UPI0037D375AA
MVNQFTINLGFNMLMPYLASHLAGSLGLAAWAVGLVLGVRHFSQQGMFLLGGTIADRLGYKAPILTGCLLRTVGFGMLGWAESLPALICASVATGFAGALFNPAVRACLATEAGERRVDAFAVFNVYYQGGMLLGPVAGLALLAVDFRLVCAVAATVFAGLSVLQWRALPARRGRETGTALGGVVAQWRTVAANRPFVLFAVSMAASYVLAFQVYMALPLAATDALGADGSLVTRGLFVVSAAVAVVGQLRLTEGGTFAPSGGELVLKAFGHGQQAGGWLADKHPRFLADTTGDDRLDIVGCHDDGVWVSLQDEDGAFSDPLYILDDFGVDQGWSSVEEHPRFLVRTTGGGAVDIVGFGPQGVVVSRGCGDGTFEPSKLVLNDFGLAQGWTSGKHLRFLADVTGDGNPDIVGFGDEGVWVSHSPGDGQFEQAQLVCRGFGYNEDAGGWRVDRHPRFLADITGDGRVDIVGFGGPGVYVARNLFRRFRTR